MKNQFILFTILLFLTNITYSQNRCTNDSCIYGPYQRYTEVICGDYAIDPNGNGVDQIFVPYIIAVHNYQIIECGGRLSILNLAPLIIDNRAYLRDSLQLGPFNNQSCFYTLNDTLTLAELYTFMQQSSASLLSLLGLPDSTYIDVRSKGACLASVKLELPEGEYEYSTGGDNPTIETFYHHQSSPIYQFIECAQNCCISRFVSVDSSNANGQWQGWGIRRWQYIGSSVEGPNCESIEPPNYYNYPDKISFTESGTGRTVYPKHISTSGCANNCQINGQLNKVFLKSDEHKTDVGLVKNIELSPVPFNTYLAVNTKTEVKQYHILDNVGNILIKSLPNATNFTINTSALKPGIYYIQFFLNNGQVVSYKIIK